MADFYSYCYAQFDEFYGFVTCNKRLVRKYCSPECRGADSRSGHTQWCGNAGENGTDYEVRESKSTGLGVFDLRKLRTGEIVMVEEDMFQSKALPRLNI